MDKYFSNETSVLRSQLQELGEEFKNSIRNAIQISLQQRKWNEIEERIKIRDSDNKAKTKRKKKFGCTLRTYLRHHAKKSYDRNIYFCIICHEQFDYFMALREHSESVHSMTDLKIEDESKYTTVCITTRNNSFICEVCGARLSTLPSLKSHIATVHKGESYKNHICKACGENFSMKKMLKIHEVQCAKTKEPDEKSDTQDKQATGKQKTPRSFQCTYAYCKRRFTGQRGLDIHLKLHETGFNHKCEICDDATYKTRASLETHCYAKHKIRKLPKKNSVIKRTPFTCSQCNLQFDCLTSISHHYDGFHKGEKMWKCDFKNCNKFFMSHTGLQQHKKIHKGIKNFNCQVCHKAFLSKHKLKIHSVIHLEDKPFKCELCNKGFTAKATLTYHMRAHKGEKPLQCEFCPSRFSSPASLYLHRTTHSTESPFVCETCGKSFKNKPALRIHTKYNHEEVDGVKNGSYGKETCSVCGKCVTHLQRHMLTHTGEKPFACEACGLTFAQSGTMHKHRREKHGLTVNRSSWNQPRLFIGEELEKNIEATTNELGSRVPAAEISERDTEITNNTKVQEDVGGFECDDDYVDDLSQPNECWDTNLTTEDASPPIVKAELPNGPNHSLMYVDFSRENLRRTASSGTIGHSYLEDPAHFWSGNLERLGDRELVVKLEKLKEYHCKKCDVNFFLKAHFLNHCKTRLHRNAARKEENERQISPCPKQQKNHKLNKNLKEIQSRGHPYECNECNKKFDEWKTFRKHYRSHDQTKAMLKCKVCEKCFRKPSQLLMHERVHTGLKMFQCDLCGKRLASAASLGMHKQLHEGNTPFKCTDCEKAYTSALHLKRHWRTFHLKEVTCTCDLCGKEFADKSDFNRHYKTHSKDKTLPPPGDIQNLKPYVPRPKYPEFSGEKKYTCKQCGQSFRLKTTLWCHKKAHSDARPYQCETCGKGFKRRNALSLHVRLHLNIRPYKCDICPLAFVSSNSLKKHAKRHEYPAPMVGATLECTICKKSCSSKLSLGVHMSKAHHSNPPVKCNICGKVFKLIRNLDNHVAKCHEDVPALKSEPDKKDAEKDERGGQASNEIPARLYPISASYECRQPTQELNTNIPNTSFLIATDLSMNFNHANNFHTPQFSFGQYY